MNPALWERVVGQPAAVAALQAAARRPVHAYLFVGPPGVGKFAAARAFAASLLCPQGGCAACDVCARAIGGRHPDVSVIEREGASISIDQSREVIRLALRSPLEGARKVLVLVDFHLVTSAGPALLKIIEEPPAGTVFVVLAEHVPPELATIASRCVQVPFSPLSRTALVDALAAEGVETARALEVASAAGGRLDRARLLAADANFSQRLEFWRTLPRRIDGSGAAVAVLAAEAIDRLDAVATRPLEARQAAEVEALEAQIAVSGARGSVGPRKELAERHKREQKRLRDDELRFGLAVLSGIYRDSAVARGPGAAEAMAATETIARRAQELVRNPTLTLFLQALFLALPTARSEGGG